MVSTFVLSFLLVGISCVLLSVYALWRWHFEAIVRPLLRLIALIDDGDTDELYAALHPDVQSEIEKPLLAALVACCRDRLGRYQDIDTLTLQSMRGTCPQGPLATIKATLVFEKDNAVCDVATCGEAYTAFNLRPLGVVLPLALYVQVAPYEAIAEDWLGLLLQGQAAQVFGYMHPALAKDWTALTLREAADKVICAAGGLKDDFYDAVVQSNRRVEEPPGLAFVFLVLGNTANIEGSIQLIFDGFKATLIAFRLSLINTTQVTFIDQ